MNGVPGEKPNRGRISDYQPLIRATDGLTLSQICLLSKLEPSTIQNWIKRGFVPHPIKKKYHERHLARILLISELRDSMQIDRVGELLRCINGDTDDESDDIITEERLYDVFREIAITLDDDLSCTDRIEELTFEKAGSMLSDIPADAKSKITDALRIMAYAYSAGLYKNLAEEMFNTFVKE